MGWSKRKRIPYRESLLYRFAPRPYQTPDAINTTAHAPVNSIKKGEGNMN